MNREDTLQFAFSLTEKLSEIADQISDHRLELIDDDVRHGLVDHESELATLMGLHDVIIATSSKIFYEFGLDHVPNTTSELPDDGIWSTSFLLAEAMESNGWSVSELSEQSGVARGTIQNILDGTTISPRKSTKDKLEDALTIDRGRLDGTQ